ncbi:hypothetical protein CBR56_13465 [Bacillus thuringiensis]|uniref:hypothetical protein n=1 Tax=Bacillus tropicus TaxID=2026188 RepID=UPI000B433100|nr:hypothetical protein [Bacillus tropicus]MED3034055.1 hypothetical protein [Bacillus tropicus]OTX75638.1 hypothetical protein BK728_29005 [Bacillus thuringiensis serovar chanpaisis]PNK28937.1 hypothetical protein CBR56_13465 [Bacillus thuringiensis]
MALERVYVCTSKNSSLYRIYLLQTGDQEKQSIFNYFELDLTKKKSGESEMDVLNGNALIEDIPYYIKLEEIDEDSYLYNFKVEIETLLNNPTNKIVQFSKFGKLSGEVKNFEENEGIKFLIVQDNESLYFLSIAKNAVIKNKPVISFSITEDTTVVDVPKGIQVPPAVTARLDRVSKKLFVYDVNRFESMLTLNENRKAKSQATINKFVQGEYTISSAKYKFLGLDENGVTQKLYSSARAVRRLSKYGAPETNYSIEQIKDAVNKLDSSLRVTFDDTNKTINVTPDTAKTFVGIIHNSIVQRLISGEVEIAI